MTEKPTPASSMREFTQITLECPRSPYSIHQWAFMMKALKHSAVGPGDAETVFFCQWCLKEKRVPE